MIIVFRYIWAAVLSMLLGYCFNYEWNWEHNPVCRDDGSKGKFTFVMIRPVVLICFLILYLGILLYYQGLVEGIYHFFSFSFNLVLTFTLYFLLLMPFRGMFRRYFSKRACAICWLLPTFIFINVNVLLIASLNPFYMIYIPRNVFTVVMIIWALGFLVIFGKMLLEHFLFTDKVKKNAYVIHEKAVTELFLELQEEIGYKRPVKLLASYACQTPFSMGFSDQSRMVIIPAGKESNVADQAFYQGYRKDELCMIFLHELHHLQRCDVDTRFFLSFLKAFAFFNPIILLAVKNASEDLELSCDEIATKDLDEAGKKAYAALLLKEAGPQKGFTTCLSAKASVLKYRMTNVVKDKSLFKGTFVVAALMFILSMCFGMIGITTEKTDFKAITASDNIKFSNLIYYFDGPYHGAYVKSYDSDVISDVFEEIELYRLSSGLVFFGRESGDSLTIYTSHNGRIRIKDDILSVGEGNMIDRFYKVKGEIDWEKLKSSMVFTDYSS